MGLRSLVNKGLSKVGSAAAKFDTARKAKKAASASRKTRQSFLNPTREDKVRTTKKVGAGVAVGAAAGGGLYAAKKRKK